MDELPSTADYAYALHKQHRQGKLPGLDDAGLRRCIADYQRSDEEDRAYLANEIGAKPGTAKAATRPPAGWVEIETSASPEAFLEYTEGSGVVVKGQFFINPEERQWITERLFSGGYNVEEPGTKAQALMANERWLRQKERLDRKGVVNPGTFDSHLKAMRR